MGQLNHQSLYRLQKRAGRHGFTPVPFRQGSLDSLCGLYALINALRLAQSKGAFQSGVNWGLLFRDILEALDRKWWLRDVVYAGMDTKELQFCLITAKTYLMRRHHIKMQFTWPWKTKKALNLKPVLQKLQRALQDPNTVAIIGYTNANYDHWSAIQEIQEDRIILFDSEGSRLLKLSQLHFDRNQILLDGMTAVVGPEDLILMTFISA